MARLAGPSGAVYVKIAGVFTKVLDIYDWELHVGNTLRECSIKSDVIERFVVSHSSGNTFTAKRRNEGVTVWDAYIADAGNNGTQTVWRLDLVDGNAGFTQTTVNGYAKTSTLHSPGAAAVDDTFELQIDDSWTYNV